MFRFLIVLTLAASIFGFTDPVETIYSFPLTNMQGQQVRLSSYAGKKILLIILPHAIQDTGLLKPSALTAIQQRYASTLVIIGIPAIEEGYQPGDSSILKSLYPFHTPAFVYATGTRVKKSSGNTQSDLFQWLTNRTKNGHFDNDARTAGYKFFVDESGKLYGVLGAEVSLSNMIIDRILSRAPAQ